MKTGELSMYIYEHVLARHHGWDLDDIRRMDLQDFYAHLRICLVRESTEREFQAKVAGAAMGAVDVPSDESKHITNVKRHKSGAVTETETERFVGKRIVGSMKIDKHGNVLSYDQPPLE